MSESTAGQRPQVQITYDLDGSGDATYQPTGFNENADGTVTVRVCRA